MERTISVEERIRRAEERYNQRIGYALTKEENVFKEKQEVSNKKRENTTKGKLIMQIFICIIIYISYYSITNKDYIFSKDFQNDVNSFFTEKTKISKVLNDFKCYISDNFSNVSEEQIKESVNDNQVQNENSNEQTGVNEDAQEGVVNEVPNTSTNEGVGGSEEFSKNTEEDQIQKDAKEIKSKINFIKPVDGTITSTFGWRNPTVSTVPKYHTGLDIAAVSGTVIKSATDGVVEMASSEGDYGNHYYIKTGDVTIIYAHCQKLYLKEGDMVVQGQEIAEVGSTGNSTGPHLHFEVRLNDRYVDPQLILDI